jgi:protein-tyrosine phosphatase
MSDRFDVVFVCTGNRFRSPIAAATFAVATRGQPVRVRSFGTLELAGAPALPEAVTLSAAEGLDLSVHRSCSLDGVDLREADLVVGFESKHIARAVVDARAARERSFLLGELVEALEADALPDGADPLARARRGVAAAEARRGTVGAAPPPIPDPYGGTPADYERAAERVRDLTLRLAEALFPRS